MHDIRKNGHALTRGRGTIISSSLLQAEIQDALAPLIGGTDKDTFIPVTVAMASEARDAIDMRYKQIVANFPFNKDPITPFGGD
jgi:hypothetical protein